MDAVRTMDWKLFFDLHAPHYDKNPFTKNTLVEVQFVVSQMKLEPGMRILDMGCGTGRHAIELAKRGMHVTGVDLSTGMLDEARRKADAAGVGVEWIEADGTRWQSAADFDAAICLCEGGMGLIGHDEDAVNHDLALLRNIAASLKTGAPYMMTALNGYSVIRRMKDENVEQGSFNPLTMEMLYADQWELPEGTKPVYLRERLFIPPEMVALLHHAGFAVEHLYGGTAGEWGERPLKLDEIEAMYICRKR